LLGFVSLAYVFYKAYIDYGTKGYEEDYNYTAPWHGIEVPIIIGFGSLLLGVVFLLICMRTHRSFFRRRPYIEAATPTALRDPPVTEAIAPE
jgi:hypothetical protein